MTEIVLQRSVPGKSEEVQRAAAVSFARWRAQAAALGVAFVEAPCPGPVLRIVEPEAVVHPGALRAALAGGGARVVPVRPSEPYATVWEFDELGPGHGTLEPPPALLVRRAGPARAAPGFLLHSFSGRRGHARPEVAALVPPGAARVLELGCAEGALGAALEAQGARVTGIDADEEAGSVAAKRLSRVFVMPLEAALPQLEGPFDVAVAADVLEHLDDPVGALLSLRNVAPALVFSVPNGSHVSVLAGVLQGRWDPALEGIVSFDHRTYAGRSGWEALFLAGGWRVDRWLPVPLLPPRAARWLPAFHLPEGELTAVQFLGVAKRTEPVGRMALGPVPDRTLPGTGATRNALAAAFPLFRGEVATERGALVAAVTRKGASGIAPSPLGRGSPPEEASRARTLGLPVAWEDLEAERWSDVQTPRPACVEPGRG
jgi:hypothetical protein